MTQNRFVITEFWQRNHNSSLKVYYSDEIDVVTKSVTKNWDLLQQKIRQQRQKIFIAKVDTINKTGSVFSLKPQEFFSADTLSLRRLLSPFLHRSPSSSFAAIKELRSPPSSSPHLPFSTSPSSPFSRISSTPTSSLQYTLAHSRQFFSFWVSLWFGSSRC